MGGRPLVSVILPTFNRAYIIEQAVRSVLAQTFEDFEVLVVDDGSTDDTERVVMAMRDPRLRYLRHETNQGGAAARNTGIAAARGEYVAFLDSDAAWMQTKLERQLESARAAEPETVVVYTGGYLVKGQDKVYLPSKRFSPREGNLHEILFWENFIDTPALLVKRDGFTLAGTFDSRLKMCQDWDLCLRLSKHFRFILIDEPLYTSFIQENSISINVASAISALKILYDKYYDEINLDKRLSAHYCNLIGMSYCRNNEFNVGRKYIANAILKDILLPKYWISYLLTFLGHDRYGQLLKYHRSLKG
jgi:glycosyltransferase involved in cell wall biosynthesis